MKTLLVTCGHLARQMDAFNPELERSGIKSSVPVLTGQQFDAAEMCTHIRDQVIVIAGDDIIDRAVIEAGRNSALKAIVKWGIGTDGIDKAAAKELGIPVYNTPGVFSDEVADMALGYALMLARGLHLIDRGVRAGQWPRYSGITLSGKVAGVIGLGGIGRAVMKRCAAFGMTVVGYDPVAIDPALLAASGGTQASLERVLAESDFILVTCALTPESFHLLSADAFATMKAGVQLVNVSRGPVIDETALTSAIESGKLGGAALDVFEVEPLPADSVLRQRDNVILGAHNGSNTREAVQRVNRLTVDLALDLFGMTGQPPRLTPLVAV